jgi:hypothetical protein
MTFRKQHENRNGKTEKKSQRNLLSRETQDLKKTMDN